MRATPHPVRNRNPGADRSTGETWQSVAEWWLAGLQRCNERGGVDELAAAGIDDEDAQGTMQEALRGETAESLGVDVEELDRLEDDGRH